jgi:uncharacterized protein YfaA (DUF2138 family)
MEGMVVWGVDKDIVHVDHDISLIDEVTEYVVYHQLKGSWGIREAKKHDHWFKQPSVGFEHFPLVTIVDANVVISPTDVQLRKECRSMTVHSCEPIHEFTYQGERGSILYSEGVQFVVILDGSKIAILLLDEEEWEHIA